jgi:hypothetical protein
MKAERFEDVLLNAAAVLVAVMLWLTGRGLLLMEDGSQPVQDHSVTPAD